MKLLSKIKHLYRLRYNIKAGDKDFYKGRCPDCFTCNADGACSTCNRFLTRKIVVLNISLPFVMALLWLNNNKMIGGDDIGMAYRFWVYKLMLLWPTSDGWDYIEKYTNQKES